MFNLERNETFKEKIKVQVKTESGSWREEFFVGVFRRVDEERQRELAQMTFNEVVDEVLVGWEMKDVQGRTVEFTPDNLAAFKKLPGAARETALGFLAANAGAKQKN